MIDWLDVNTNKDDLEANCYKFSNFPDDDGIPITTQYVMYFEEQRFPSLWLPRPWNRHNHYIYKLKSGSGRGIQGNVLVVKCDMNWRLSDMTPEDVDIAKRCVAM